jgi:hypothetical protein
MAALPHYNHSDQHPLLRDKSRQRRHAANITTHVQTHRKLNHGIKMGLLTKSQNPAQKQAPVMAFKWFSKRFKKTPEDGECLACTETIPKKKLVRLNCKHTYCRECFNTLVETGVTGGNFPAKCCDAGAITHRQAVRYCNPATYKLYLAAERVASIPADSRWYCPHPTCSFLHDKRKMTVINGAICCRKCKQYGCDWCEAIRPQYGHFCREGALDSCTEDLLKMGELNGWRQCFACKSMIEIRFGCRQMTCTCKAIFW